MRIEAGVFGGIERAGGEAAPSGAASLFDQPERGSLTRRRLLELSALAAVAQLPLFNVAYRAVGANSTASTFKRSTYGPLLGQRFTLSGSGGPSIGTRLVEIRNLNLSAGPPRAGEEAFALRFHGPRAPRLDQGMYVLRHPRFTSTALLVTPSGTGRRGQDYEVVVNQSRAGRG